MKLIPVIGTMLFFLPVVAHAQAEPGIFSSTAESSVEMGTTHLGSYVHSDVEFSTNVPTVYGEDSGFVVMRDYARQALKGELPALTSAEAVLLAQWMALNLPPNEAGFVSVFGEQEGKQLWGDYQLAIQPSFSGERVEETQAREDGGGRGIDNNASGGLKR